MSRKPLKVLWRSRVGSTAAAGHERRDGIELRVETDRDEARRLADWAQVLIDGNPEPQMLGGASLQHVIVPYAGISPGLRKLMLEHPRLGLSNSHFNAPFVAQHAVALLLACANRIVEGDRALRTGDWGPRDDDAFTSLQLDGRTALLLGYGAIGREIEKRVRGLGMEVAVLRRRPPRERDDVREFGPDELHEALASADAVMVSLPHTPATEGLLGSDALAALGPDAVLVNVGRGPVIDAAALYEALSRGRFRAAGLDVWWRYPENDGLRSSTFPAEPPLHELPNVVMSPHRANQVANWEEAAFRDVLETLRCLAEGRERNRVDPATGY